ASAVVRVRQPLARALVGAAGFAALPAGLRAQVAEELNVHALEPLEAVADDLVSYTVRPSFRALGRRFGPATPGVAAAIEAADPAGLAQALRSQGSASVPVDGLDGSPVRLAPDEVIVTQTPRSGWAVASDAGETVALEVTITPQLRREGYAREAVRLVQDARKGDGLEVSDRISLRWSTADPDLAWALTEHGALISSEVLAVDYGEATGDDSGAEAGAGAGVEHSDPDLGLTFWIRRS
ncbi:MAG: DUF5915 domain-containing protein, partial [Streptosporangiaceae bacterium]